MEHFKTIIEPFRIHSIEPLVMVIVFVAWFQLMLPKALEWLNDGVLDEMSFSTMVSELVSRN